MSRNFEAMLRAGREAELLQSVTIPAEIPLNQEEEPTLSPMEPTVATASPEVTARNRVTVHESHPRFVTRPRSPRARIDAIVHEEEMKLVQRVFLLAGCETNRAVVFCGVDRGGGAVGICARAGENLAEQTGSQVCLVEGDLHSSSLGQYFGLDNEYGLTDAVLDARPVQDYVQRLAGSNLSLLLAGPRCDEVHSPWKSEQLRTCLEELRREYTYVLIYAPPANQHIDAMLLGQMTDGVVVVVESNVSRRETARKVAENFAAAQVRVLGAVLNNRTFPIPESIYRKL